MHAIIASSLQRFHPQTPLVGGHTLGLEVARGERASFQVAYRTADLDLRVTAEVESALPVQVRRVGHALAAHVNTGTPAEELDGLPYLPGYVPDPLFPEATAHTGPFTTGAFWITVRVPKDVEPGRYPVAITLAAEGLEPVTLTAHVTVHRAVLPARQNFPVTHWFYADALLDWYKLQPWEEAFWPIVQAYFADLVDHGQDTVYVPVFTPPLDGVKRASQLLHVTRDGDRYVFDWTMVRRWIHAARAAGVTRFEWTHFFTQWGVRFALRIYEGFQGPLLWDPETGATSDTYRTFLAQFIPELERFLDEEHLRDCSFFHVSDEPHGEEHLANYRAARALLKELAPWMTVMDALSQIEFARAGLTDVPIPIIETAPQFIAEGFPAWTYFCCAPRGRFLNRLFDTPLIKVRMSGWLFYRTRVHGFLHWGYNYWCKSQTQQIIDPYTVTDGLMWPGWAHGDTMMVYPGEAGPVDSLRWEVFADSLQDYTLLQAAGIDPDSLADIRDYADFPRDPAWIAHHRAEALARLDAM